MDAYHKCLVGKAIDDTDNKAELKINVLDAIRLISNPWDSDITESIIKKCFKNCGFFKSRNCSWSGPWIWSVWRFLIMWTGQRERFYDHW